MSDETALAIDKEVRSIIDECYEKARILLEEHRGKMDIMAEALMQYETIDADQIEDIMSGHKPRPPKDWRDQGPGNGAAATGDPKPGDDAIGGPANNH